MNRRHRILAWVLCCLGCLDLLALAATAAPHGWLAAAHAWLGLGPLPAGPLVGYLARSAAALYALHGATVLFLSRDVARYWGLIRFLAVIALGHGAVMAGIDWVEGMPLWWRLVEGPCFAAGGAVVLVLQHWAGAPRQ